MSFSLLSLLIRHDGPATMGLHLRSLRFGIFIYSDFCVSTAFFLFVWTCEFLVIRRSYWLWRSEDFFFRKKSSEVFFLKKKIVISKFQTTLPHLYAQKISETHTHTHTRRKISVSEIPNHSNTHTHTHTQRQKHIKYQWGIKLTKVNTL